MTCDTESSGEPMHDTTRAKKNVTALKGSSLRKGSDAKQHVDESLAKQELKEARKALLEARTPSKMRAATDAVKAAEQKYRAVKNERATTPRFPWADTK